MGNRYNRKHGLWQTHEYHAWENMKARCLNPNHPSFGNYGARGIAISERWLSSENFIADMGPCPIGLTLERRDNSLGYFKENCLWATRKAQQRNRRVNRLLAFRGRVQCVRAWADEFGLKYGTLSGRLNYGWTIEHALTAPPDRSNRHKNVHSVSHPSPA